MAAEVGILLKGVADLGTVFKDATAGLQEIGKEAEANQSKLGGLGDTIKGLGKAAVIGGAAAAGTAIIGVGKAALDVKRDIGIATKDIAVQLGITKEEAAGFEGTMTAVFANNFGENFQDIAEGVVAMNRNLGEVPADWQQGLLEGAFAIRDAFGVDLNETMMAVQSLVSNFGITGPEALDLVTAGFQRGLDTSGDFLDTINEYSTQFSDAGADAGQFFSLLESGMQGGALGTDKAADAFKEFRIRFSEMSEDASGALAAIGLNELPGQFEAGEISAIDAFEAVLAGLREVEDPITQFQLGQTLIGTQFEDMGTKAGLALDTTGTKLSDLAGSTTGLNLQYENFGALVEGTWRTFLVSLQPAMEALLQLANEAMPHVLSFMQTSFMPAIEKLAGWMTNQLPEAIAKVSDFWTNTLMPAMEPVMSFVTGVLIPAFEALIDILVGHSVHDAIQTVADFFTTVLIPAATDVRNFIEQHVVPLFEALANVTFALVGRELQALADLWNDTLQPAFSNVAGFVTETVVPNMEKLEPALTIVGDALAPLGDLLDGLTGDLNAMAGEIESGTPIIERLAELLGTDLPPIIAEIQRIIGEFVAAVAKFWEDHGETITRAVGAIWEAIGTIIETAFTAIGTILETGMGVLQGIITTATGILSGDWDTAWQGMGTIVESLLTGLETVVELGLGAVVKIINDAMSAFGIEWQISWDAIKAVVDAMFVILNTSVDAALLVIQGTIAAAMAVLKGDWETVWEEVKGILDTVWQAMNTIVSTVFETLIQPLIERVLKAIKEFWDETWSAIKTFLETTWTNIQTAIETALSDFFKAIEQALIDTKTAWDTAWADILEALRQVIPNLLKLVGDAVDELVKKFTDVDWGKIGRDLIDGVKSGISRGASALTRAIKNLVDDVIEKFTDVDWGSIGSGIIGGITSGVKGAAGGLADAAKGAAQGALDKAKGFLGIGSPSRVWADEVGVPIVEGIALGITENADAILGALIDAILEALEELRALLFVGTGTGTAHETGFDMMAAVAEGIRGGERILSETLGEVVGRVLDPILAQGLGEEFGQAVGAGMAIGLGYVPEETTAPGTGPQPWADLNFGDITRASRLPGTGLLPWASLLPGTGLLPWAPLLGAGGSLPGTGMLPWTPLPGTSLLPWADMLAPPDEVAEEIADNVSDAIDHAVDLVQSAAPDLARAITSVFDLGRLGIERIMVAPGGFHGAGVWKEVNRFDEFLEAGLERLREVIPRIVEALSGLDVRTVDVSWFTEPVAAVTEALMQAAEDWHDFALRAVGGLIRGIRSGIPVLEDVLNALVHSVQNAVQAIIDALNQIPRGESPLPQLQNFISGIQEAYAPIQRSMAHLVETIQNPILDMRRFMEEQFQRFPYLQFALKQAQVIGYPYDYMAAPLLRLITSTGQLLNLSPAMQRIIDIALGSFPQPSAQPTYNTPAYSNITVNIPATFNLSDPMERRELANRLWDDIAEAARRRNITVQGAAA